jgi:molecular chaperone GrpE
MIGKKKKQTMEKDQEKLDQQQESPCDESLKDACEGGCGDDCKDSMPDAEEPNAMNPGKDKDEQIAELNDKYLRLYAEFDNYRRRTLRERIELIQGASSDMMVAMLPVLDDLDRAVKAFEQSQDIVALKDGVVLIQQKFKGILTQKGLSEIKSLGEDFNTDLHEAIANVPAEKEALKDKVVDEVEKGYYLNGKVIRFAKVVVAN